MEELLQHCMRELAFDGDLGCDVSRLRHFVQGFYASQQHSGIQNVDDAFHAFVWGLLVRQPSVCVGLVPEGDALEVYIAPQRRKNNPVTKPKKKLLMPELVPFPALDRRDGYSAVTDDSTSELFLGRIQPIPEAATSSLEFLVKKYGHSLRVAVDPETCFRALTGTHIRPAKLSPMVYTALQLISRGREAGLSVIDLGKKTGYDQKTCFYVVLQLLSLDLVVKLGKGGPGGGNFCIHKYFYSQSAFWKSVRSEGHMDEEEDATLGGKSFEHRASTGPRPKLQFDPIDSRHLASTELIKSRLVKLLKNSENGLHLYHNLIVTIGFSKPTKQDRRFFTIRIRELIKDNVIEKVIVPKLHGSSSALCIRLVADPRTEGTEGIIVQPGDVGDEEPGEILEDKDMAFMPVTNMTIHRQVLKLLEHAGLEGLTLFDISTRLGNFDKRTVELILHRLERFLPPPHLADLAACEFLENQGRERHHRYYTLTGYLSFIRNENIDDVGGTSRYTSMDISQSGGFHPQTDHQFYNDSAALIRFQDEYKDKAKPVREGPLGKIRWSQKGDSKPSNGKSVTKDETTRSMAKPRGKRTEAAGDQEGSEDQVRWVSNRTTERGPKRKKKDDLNPSDPTSEIPPPQKKRRVLKKNSTQKEDHPAGSMDMYKDTVVRPPEPPRNCHSETFTAPRVENVLSPGTNSNNIGLLPSNFDRNIVDAAMSMPHQVPILSDISATKDVMPPSTSGASPGSQVLSSALGVAPLMVKHTPVSQGFYGTAPTPETATGSKRSDMFTDTHSDVEEYPGKRPSARLPKQPRINISQLRAENEIMRVVEKSGGIANISSKDFWESYAHIISSMVEAGEPTSMPIGTQPDRRTINKLLERLVDRGKLKTLTTTLTPRVTQPRLAKLIYEPLLSQERLDQFVSALREEVPAPSIPIHKKLDHPMHFTRPKSLRVCDPVSAQDGGSDEGDEENNFRSGIVLSEEDGSVTRSVYLRRGKIRERQAGEDRVLLAKKAAGARQQLESDWDALVSRVQLGPLPYGSSTKLKALRARYLNSRGTLTIQQWESAVTEVISGSKSGRKKPVLPSLRSSPRKPSLRTGASKPLPEPLEQQKSVNELIERYKDKVTAGQVALQKKKSKETDADNTNVVSTTVTELPRRQRFQWTSDYDELARDASVVIRARCRTWYRMDWTAVDQLFPFLPRNSVRQRLVTLRQEAGGETYLRLLEDRWHELWLDHRGTEALPDDSPDHPSDFDAIAHVEFLRKYIDKGALRAGVSEAEVYHAAGAVLTNNVSDFLSRWELGEHARPTNKMDFIWSSIGDEHREKTLLGEAFSTTQPLPLKLVPTDSYLNGVAEAVLKMTLTTLEEDYDARDAALLLEGVGQEDVRRASEDLLSRGVISQVGNSRRKTPGRKLKISDVNEEALGGSFRSDFFSDACAIEDVVGDDVDGWNEWTPVCTDGEMAAFIELVSGGKVEFHIDVSGAAAHRQELDWNSKKVDDDQIETSLTMRCLAIADPPEGPPTPWRVDMELDMELDEPNVEDHSLNNGVPAPCRRSSKGIVTCMACIRVEQKVFLAALEPEDRELCLEIIEKLERAGRHGLSYESFIIDPLSLQSMETAVRRLTSSKHPLCYWVGYTRPVLVSRLYIRDWTVSLPSSPLHFIFPRRWLNIRGEQMTDVWNAGLRAVVGVLVARPGIPQTELRQRLASVYDRQELNDLLEYLWIEEMIVKRTEAGTFISKDVRAVGGAQEQNVYWSLNVVSPWYHVNE